MALRDYYRCKECDAKIAYGPDRSEVDWEPFLLCRSCVTDLRAQVAQLSDVASKSLAATGCEGDCESDTCAHWNLRRLLIPENGGAK